MPEEEAAAPSVRPKRIEEADAYTSAVAGVHVDAVRIGDGIGPNLVLGLPHGRVTVTSSRVGFPICTHSHIDEGHLTAAYIKEVGESSKWCGIDLQPGQVIVYGPGVEHAAINRPGLHFLFAITRTDQLADLADRLEMPIRIPSRGEVQVCQDSGRNSQLGDALLLHKQRALAGQDLGPSRDEVARAMAWALFDENPRIEPRRCRGIDSNSIVHACLDFLEEVERITSIEELCGCVHVSERRLRAAFIDEFDLPPSRFIRAWALDRAHQALRDADPNELSVTEVAAGLGFGHLGRFSTDYRSLYGEKPSETLELSGDTSSV